MLQNACHQNRQFLQACNQDQCLLAVSLMQFKLHPTLLVCLKCNNFWKVNVIHNLSVESIAYYMWASLAH